MSNLSSTFGSWVHGAKDALVSDPLGSIDLSPKSVKLPIYFAHRESILPWISDKHLSLLLPIVCYWGFSLVYQAIDVWQHPFFEKYRIHEPEEVTKRNRVTKSKVIQMVVLQQLIQTILGTLVLDDDEVVRQQVFTDHKAHMRSIGVYVARSVVGLLGMKRGMPLLDAYGSQATEWLYWWGIPVAQFWFAL